MDKLDRTVSISSAYDKTHTDPKKNYGVGACRITFLVQGPEGAVQFVIGTNWYLPKTQRSQRAWQQDYNRKFDKIAPDGWDVGYHSPKPMYSGQDDTECCYLPSGRCYYDGSSLRAIDWALKLIEGGTNWLWPELEKEYQARFLDGDEEEITATSPYLNKPLRTEQEVKDEKI